MSYEDSLKNSWAHMRERCMNPNHKQFKDFGGKGITFHDSWYLFENFEKWSLENGYKKGLHLGRKDTNANYCPENCIFVTAEEQANNRNNNRFETYRGVTDTVINLCRKFNKNYNSVRNKIKRGVSITQAMDSTDKVFVTPDHSDPVKVARAKKAKAARSALA